MTKISKKIVEAAATISASGKTPWVIIDDKDRVVEVMSNKLRARAAHLGRVEKFEAEKFIVISRGRAPGYESDSSKRKAALEIYMKSADKSRKAMLEAWNKKFGMSEAMASTYYYHVKKMAEGEPAAIAPAADKKTGTNG